MNLFGAAFDIVTTVMKPVAFSGKSPLKTLGILDTLVPSKYSGRKVTPAIGSVVWCELAGHFEHSGIYIGKNRIIHLDGDGTIVSTSARKFKSRLFGLNPAINVYVSTQNGVSVGSRVVAQRAEQMIGQYREYNLLFDNCHQFTAGCLTGDFENSNNFFWLLEMTIEEEYGSVNWNKMREVY